MFPVGRRDIGEISDLEIRLSSFASRLSHLKSLMGVVMAETTVHHFVDILFAITLNFAFGEESKPILWRITDIPTQIIHVLIAFSATRSVIQIVGVLKFFGM